MNSLLAPKKEKVANPVGSQCFYCKRVFKNHQALARHLRVHQEEINSDRSSSYPSHFCNSITSRTESFRMRDPENFSVPCWSYPSTVFSKAPAPLDFSTRFYSNEKGGMNVSKFYGKGTSAMPLKFSSSSGHAEVQNSKPLPLIAPAPAGGVVPTGVPVPFNPPFFMVPCEVFQLNTDQFHSPGNGMPSCSSNALPYLQDHNYGMTPYLMNAATDRHPGLISSQSPGFKDANSGQGEISQYKTQSVVISGKDKRRKLGEAEHSTEIAFKRPKINSKLSVETDKPPKRELLLFKDVECFAGLGIASYAEGESQTNVDVSLHL